MRPPLIRVASEAPFYPSASAEREDTHYIYLSATVPFVVPGASSPAPNTQMRSASQVFPKKHHTIGWKRKSTNTPSHHPPRNAAFAAHSYPYSSSHRRNEANIYKLRSSHICSFMLERNVEIERNVIRVLAYGGGVWLNALCSVIVST